MKVHILTLVAFIAALCCQAAEKKQLTYTDASELTIVNRAQADCPRSRDSMSTNIRILPKR